MTATASWTSAHGNACARTVATTLLLLLLHPRLDVLSITTKNWKHLLKIKTRLLTKRRNSVRKKYNINSYTKKQAKHEFLGRQNLFFSLGEAKYFSKMYILYSFYSIIFI